MAGFEDKVRVVLEELKKRGLYFLDSRTSPKSRGYRVGRALAMRSDKRDVFLDNKQEVDSTESQLRKLIRIAKTEGSAVGICHPYPSTVAALRRLPESMDDGVALVSLSHIVNERCGTGSTQ
jgi:hypothetical protein